MTIQSTIDIQQLKNTLIKGTITLLDVRRKEDYETSPQMIPGAVWRDPEKVDQWQPELTGDIVIYCVRGGSVSQLVSQQLSDKGLAVSFIEGGLKAWVDQGEPVK